MTGPSTASGVSGSGTGGYFVGKTAGIDVTGDGLFNNDVYVGGDLYVTGSGIHDLCAARGAL